MASIESNYTNAQVPYEEYVKNLERKELESECINKGMMETKARCRQRRRLIEFLMEKHNENPTSATKTDLVSPTNGAEYQALLAQTSFDSCEDDSLTETTFYSSLPDIHPHSRPSSKTKEMLKPAITASEFIQTIQEQFDLTRNQCLQHPKLAIIMSQQRELLNLMKTVENLQECTIGDLLDDMCFDEEDRKYLPMQNQYISRTHQQQSRDNALMQLYLYQQQIVSSLEYIVSRRIMKFKSANVNIAADKELALKEEILQRLCTIEQKKRVFIENTILNGNINHPVFIEAKLMLSNRRKSLLP